MRMHNASDEAECAEVQEISLHELSQSQIKPNTLPPEIIESALKNPPTLDQSCSSVFESEKDAKVTLNSNG